MTAQKSSIEQWGESGLYRAPMAVIDFETTGFKADECRIIQVAIVHSNLGMKNQEVVYKGYINPCCDIPKESTKVHHITNDMVCESGTFADCKDEILSHLDNRLLGAYNLPFDYGFLNAELGRCGEGLFPWFGICGMILARYVDTEMQGKGYHKLENVAGRRGIKFNPHDAGEDAMATSLLLDSLMGEASQRWGKRFNTIREYWSFQREVAIQQERKLRERFRRTVWPWTDW